MPGDIMGIEHHQLMLEGQRKMTKKSIASELHHMAENRINVDEDAEILTAAAVMIELYEERLAQFERALKDIAYLRVPPKRVGFLKDIALRALAVRGRI